MDKDVGYIQVHLVLLLFPSFHFEDNAFLHIEGRCQPCLKQIYSHHFSNIAHFLFMCYILVILTIVEKFSLLLCLLW